MDIKWWAIDHNYCAHLKMFIAVLAFRKGVHVVTMQSLLLSELRVSC